jgi:F-type H+-transporting ATPase subunit a
MTESELSPTSPHAENPQEAGSVPAHEGAAAQGHGGEGGHTGEPELENFWNLLAKSSLNKEGTFTGKIIKPFDPYMEKEREAAQYTVNKEVEILKIDQAATLHKVNQNVFFGLVSVALVWFLLWRGMRKNAMIPGRFQGLIEVLIDGLCNFFTGILGEKHARPHLPFLVSLFLFIMINNLLGLVPLMKSSTGMFQTNIVLGLCVFVYVQYQGLRRNGPKNYVLHLMGNPKDPITWCLAPFMFLLELPAEFIKPLSLSLRLFGNIMGEDLLLGVFVMLGIMLTKLLLTPLGITDPIVAIPLHFPFLFLATLTSVIQALIFSLLSCVYILLMLPHDEHEH